MHLIDWIPSISTTAGLAIALWLCRNLISTRLTKSVQHEFDRRLEAIRAELRQNEELFKADLRSKEAEIAALRAGALTALSTRQMALDKRRLEAIEQIWTDVTALTPAKSISSLMAIIKYDNAVKETARNERFRQTFVTMGSGWDIKKYDSSNSAKARPFVSPMVWALFSAYRSILFQAVAKLEVLKLGIGEDFIDRDGIGKLVKAALPHQAALIDKYGDSAYHHLLDELEARLLGEFRKMMAGEEADKESIEQAAKIVRLSDELNNSTELKKAQDMEKKYGTQAMV